MNAQEEIASLPEKGETYKCDACGGTFETEWSHAEAKAEYERLWGAPSNADDVAVICSECFDSVIGAPES